MKFINTFILVLILNILTAVTINIPADYSTIQEGINAANDGDIVIVSQGTYFENLTINKEITLKSNIAINELELDWYNNTIIKETVINGSIVNDPKKRKAFAARHKCSQKTDRTKASYWSCRLPRYAKQLGLSVKNPGAFW